MNTYLLLLYHKKEKYTKKGLRLFYNFKNLMLQYNIYRKFKIN